MRTFRDVCLRVKKPPTPGAYVEVALDPRILDWPVIEPPTPGGPCWVVTKEAAETVDRVTAEAANGYEYLADKDRVLINIRAIVWAGIAALLGNVRVAKAVGRAHGCTVGPILDGVSAGDEVAVLED